tara:strand:- start:207 stop:431 length:225 start_codon:yes stop_codon:yes gene_type:complete
MVVLVEAAVALGLAPAVRVRLMRVVQEIPIMTAALEPPMQSPFLVKVAVVAVLVVLVKSVKVQVGTPIREALAA